MLSLLYTYIYIYIYIYLYIKQGNIETLSNGDVIANKMARYVLIDCVSVNENEYAMGVHFSNRWLVM